MLNARHVERVEAEAKLQGALVDVIQKFNLSFGEILVIMSKLISNWAYHLQKEEDDIGLVHTKRKKDHE